MDTKTLLNAGAIAGAVFILVDSSWFMFFIYSILIAVLYFKHSRQANKVDHVELVEPQVAAEMQAASESTPVTTRQEIVEDIQPHLEEVVESEPTPPPVDYPSNDDKRSESASPQLDADDGNSTLSKVQTLLRRSSSKSSISSDEGEQAKEEAIEQAAEENVIEKVVEEVKQNPFDFPSQAVADFEPLVESSFNNLQQTIDLAKEDDSLIDEPIAAHNDEQVSAALIEAQFEPPKESSPEPARMEDSPELLQAELSSHDSSRQEDQEVSQDLLRETSTDMMPEAPHEIGRQESPDEHHFSEHIRQESPKLIKEAEIVSSEPVRQESPELMKEGNFIRQESPEPIIRNVSPEPITQESPEPIRQESPEPMRQESPKLIRQEPSELMKDADMTRQESPELVRQELPELMKDADKTRQESPELVRQESPEPIKQTSPELTKEAEIICQESPEFAKEAELIRQESPELIKEAELIRQESPELITEAELIRQESPELIKEAELISQELPEFAKEAELISQESPEFAKEAELISQEPTELKKETEMLRKESPEPFPEPMKETNPISQKSPNLMMEVNLIRQESPDLLKDAEVMRTRSPELMKKEVLSESLIHEQRSPSPVKQESLEDLVVQVAREKSPELFKVDSPVDAANLLQEFSPPKDLSSEPMIFETTHTDSLSQQPLVPNVEAADEDKKELKSGGQIPAEANLMLENKPKEEVVTADLLGDLQAQVSNQRRSSASSSSSSELADSKQSGDDDSSSSSESEEVKEKGNTGKSSSSDSSAGVDEPAVTVTNESKFVSEGAGGGNSFRAGDDIDMFSSDATAEALKTEGEVSSIVRHAETHVIGDEVYRADKYLNSETQEVVSHSISVTDPQSDHLA